MSLAHALCEQLCAGDTLLLQGPVGAGKTAVARAIIQHLQTKYGTAEEVPSPTFTLVQTYTAGPLEIWHTDLYRLSTLDELYELGLTEAMDTALVLVEWPERMGALLPENGLKLVMDIDANDTRQLQFEWTDAKWTDKLAAVTGTLKTGTLETGALETAALRPND